MSIIHEQSLSKRETDPFKIKFQEKHSWSRQNLRLILQRTQLGVTKSLSFELSSYEEIYVDEYSMMPNKFATWLCYTSCRDVTIYLYGDPDQCLQ